MLQQGLPGQMCIDSSTGTFLYTNIAIEIHHFYDICQERWGFSIAMWVYWRVHQSVSGCKWVMTYDSWKWTVDDSKKRHQEGGWKTPLTEIVPSFISDSTKQKKTHSENPHPGGYLDNFTYFFLNFHPYRSLGMIRSKIAFKAAYFSISATVNHQLGYSRPGN